ncbi:MAG TPA: hypothetical protein VGN34_15355, partial [Ktedonobacteraceae bacterium]
MQNMATQLEQIQRMLSSLESRLSGPPPATIAPSVVAVPPATTAQAASVAPSPASSIGAIASRELAKRTFTFTEDQQLAGPENFEQWKQGLNITFRAIGLPAFPENPDCIQSFSDSDLAVILMLLRDSCAAGPRATISWHTSPIDAYKLLLQQYAPTQDAQRDTLYREFHTLNFRGYNGSLASFNAKFAGLVSRLLLIGVQIQVADQTNQYLRALESSFPRWAERTRSNMRMIRASGASSQLLTLQYLMADVLEEQRNPTSTTAKRTEERALRAKTTEDGKKDAAQGQCSGKDWNSSSSDKPSRGKKKDKKDLQGPKSSEQEDNQEHDFSCIINYSLNPDSSESSDSDASEESCSESEPDRAVHKATRPNNNRQQHNRPPKTDLWLYDTGSSVHIVNNCKWFKDFEANTGNLCPVHTGGRPVVPKGVG